MLPLAPIGKLIKSAGTNRVSDLAKRALRKELEQHAKNISERAIKFAKYMGRSTVQESDIKKAIKNE
tara:strand:+ start:969 stop:1169 length:201 start_codon:yes stop_codon:yes gene_type:complete